MVRKWPKLAKNNLKSHKITWKYFLKWLWPSLKKFQKIFIFGIMPHFKPAGVSVPPLSRPGSLPTGGSVPPDKGPPHTLHYMPETGKIDFEVYWHLTSAIFFSFFSDIIVPRSWRCILMINKGALSVYSVCVVFFCPVKKASLVILGQPGWVGMCFFFYSKFAVEFLERKKKFFPKINFFFFVKKKFFKQSFQCQLFLSGANFSKREKKKTSISPPVFERIFFRVRLGGNGGEKDPDNAVPLSVPLHTLFRQCCNTMVSTPKWTTVVPPPVVVGSTDWSRGIVSRISVDDLQCFIISPPPQCALSCQGAKSVPKAGAKTKF